MSSCFKCKNMYYDEDDDALCGHSECKKTLSFARAELHNCSTFIDGHFTENEIRIRGMKYKEYCERRGL